MYIFVYYRLVHAIFLLLKTVYRNFSHCRSISELQKKKENIHKCTLQIHSYLHTL